MLNPFAGHSHGPTPHLVDGCPLCEHLKTARNQGIEHLSEALNLLSRLSPEGERPTIRLNLAPIDLTADDTLRCHSIDLTAKQAEALSDAVDSMNAHAGSESPIDRDLLGIADAIAEVDEVGVAQRLVRFKAWMEAKSGEVIGSGEWSAAAVAQNDPDLYADITDLFLLVDPQSYLDDVFTSQDPEASAAAYEQLVTGEWDGEL